MSTTIGVPFTLTVASPPSPPLGRPQASLTIGGTTHVFDPEDGTNLEDYVDPEDEFVQANVLCLMPGLPGFRAYYRPDTSGGREEWVFEYGDPWNPAPVNLGAYSVTIERNDGKFITLQAPEHFHLGRWRWQSEERPVRRTVEELFEAKLLPRYDGSVLSRYEHDLAAKTYSIMKLAGILPQQGTTGERPDIGIITGWQADYVCAGSNLGTIMAQAEAAGTLNWHVRETPEGDGPPMDLHARPKATMYSSGNGADPYVRRTACKVDGAPMNYDTGHSPTQAYLPFLLTGDPYYLEEVQFQAAMDLLVVPPQSRYRQQGRYLAWSMRNTLYAVAATPEVVPAWLQPRSHWERHLEGYRAYVQEIMAKGDPLHLIASGGSQANPGYPAGSYFACWQEDFLTAIFALAVRQGRTEWTDAMVWKLDCTVQRVHAEHWPWPTPTMYQANFLYAAALAQDCTAETNTIVVDAWFKPPWPPLPFEMKLQDEMTTVTAMNGNTWILTRLKPVKHVIGHRILGPKFTSWEQCAERNVAAHPEKFPTMPDDPDALYTGTAGSVTYNAYTRGALALAVGEAVPGTEAAVTSYDWLHAEFLQAISSQWTVERKWAIVP